MPHVVAMGNASAPVKPNLMEQAKKVMLQLQNEQQEGSQLDTQDMAKFGTEIVNGGSYKP